MVYLTGKRSVASTNGHLQYPSFDGFVQRMPDWNKMMDC